MDELRRKGLEKMNEVYGWEMPNIEGDDYFALTADHLFGTIWTRPGSVDARQADHDADRGDRAGHTGPRRDPGQCGAAQRGAHRDELKEMAIFLTHYLGFPLGSKLDGVVTKVAKQRKKAAEKGQGEDKKANVNAAREDALGEQSR